MFGLAAALAGASAGAALADSASFSQAQSPDDQLFHIDVTVEYARAGLSPREANSGTGTVSLSLPGVRARLDPAHPAEPAGYGCSVTSSVYGEAGAGFLCSTDGQVQGAGLAFPGTVTLHLLSADCYTLPAPGSGQPAVADVWAAPGDPGTAPDMTFQLVGDSACDLGPDEPPVDPTGSLPCLVPKLKNLTLKKAAAKLENAGCTRGKVRYSYSPKVKKGRVIAQGSKPGKRLKAGAKVTLTVSRGSRG
ncbi:MAG: hypothetical protein QOH13_1043 [Thermoleophilaceae bacterium]|nr:hypothetical protein [Thermoleophilaceae bacterium]